MLKCLGDVEWMSESRLTKDIYKADVSGWDGSPYEATIDLIGQVL